MTEFIDLDDDGIDLVEENSAFRKVLDYLSTTNDPFRLVVGVWICTGALDYAQASRILMHFECYKEVPVKDRGAHLPLALYLIEYFHKHPASRIASMPAADSFLYHTMVTMKTVQVFFTTEEQDELLKKIREKISRSRG